MAVFLQFCREMRLVLILRYFGTLFSACNCFLTVLWLLKVGMPTVNQIVQNWCLQYIGFVGHYFTPARAQKPNWFYVSRF